MKLSVKAFFLALLAVALLAGSATSLASQSTTVGKETKRCVPEPGADCRGVVERWTVEYHGDLRKAKFTGAVLHGADFRGADLRGADFRGAKLRHADFRGANLKGARFDKLKQAGKNTKQGNTPACAATTLQCVQGTNLSYANLSGANLSNVNMNGATLYGADLSNANLSGANLSGAAMYYSTLTGATLSGANLSYANLYGANLSNANLSNAKLTNANLSYAYIAGATGCSTVTPVGFLNVIAVGCTN